MDKIEIVKDNRMETLNGQAILVPENEQYSKIYKAVLLKTERLVSAVHLVTGLMDTKETLRWELRSAAVESMLEIGVSDKILKKIDRILSLLDVSLTGGLVSQMNCSILKDEYSKLKDALLKFNLTSNAGSLILPMHFFGTDLRALEPAIKDERPTRDTQLRKIKDIIAEPKNINKLSRQEAILKVIKDSTEYTIKDIISQLSGIDVGTDCSDKTVQRDLLSLVASGTLIKRGERRWSRYSKKVV